MLSIVTPTIWAFKPFPRYLEQIIGYECIDEVLIIDNRKEERPPSEIFNHPKIRILEQEENIFVNPAWNLGAKEARNENICFLSDDVITDPRCFYEADKFLRINSPKETGLLCTLIGHELHNQPKVTTGEIVIEKCEGSNIGMHGAFALFFVHKSNYLTIPEEFKIIHGDAYLWNMMPNEKKHHMLHNVFFYSPFGVSCAKVFNEKEGLVTLNKDLENWEIFRRES